MNDLETVARHAVEEVVTLTSRDLGLRYDDLRRTRARRRTVRWVAASVAAVALIAGWAVTRDPVVSPPEPAPRPDEVVNGVIMAPYSDSGELTALGGEWPAALLRDLVVPSTPMQLDHDQTHVVYRPRGERVLVAVDLETGDRSTVAPCADGPCLGTVSPDSTTVAYPGRGGPRLQSTSTGEVRSLPLAVSYAASPSWSPSGDRLAFATEQGIFTVRTDGSGLRLLHPHTSPTAMFTEVAWSPDGRRVAFFDVRAVKRDGRTDSRFTAMTVRADGSDPRVLGDAGTCFCAGLTPPSLAWSPDSESLAVATTTLRSGTGMHTARADGSSWDLLAGGHFGRPVWLPAEDGR